MINIKSKNQEKWIRIVQLYLLILILLFLIIIFIIIFKYNTYLGLLIAFMGIPFPVLLFLFQNIYNYYVIIGVDIDSSGFELLYRKRNIRIKYADIVERKYSKIQGIKGIKYITNRNFKANFLEKKGIILLPFLDDEICKIIEKGYFDYYNVNSS